jgi:hypothetical protein
LLLLSTTEEDDLPFAELKETAESIWLLLVLPAIEPESPLLLLERTSIGIKDDDDESSLATKGLLESSPPQATKIKVETKAK